MKILVAVKRVVDHNVRIRVKPDGSGVETANVRMSMNPFCKNAVEAAVQLAEQGHATEIVAVSIGPKAASDVLLTAMAMGVNRSILIETDARVEPLAVAKLLQAVVDEEKPDLVLLGKQAVDDDSNQTGQMLAGLLDWPQATFASAIEVEDGAVKVTREVDYGRAESRLPLPAIITADLRLNTPRNTALPMVMKARQKPLAVRPVAEFGVDITPRLQIEKTTPPAERSGGKTVGSVDDLVTAIGDDVANMEAL
ncbi:electron transfer flavoprotein subunit beta/FixA family protein [Mariluticola halotolerans]|uniref:electron transfer flavoprotein subunit beta/FixA family protein n=1 Tax=Mariluticola halotolerans TaxID=2909283 RepID=UPI0026E42E58|nr:electron transfer flavoprotein subunit beta/FixA family protein [Mariluticola halotolerans]UJQ92959.1 electron transfer flavoprotein subunit beta/FixA family protein [Mariluticola halotolerans]